MGSGAGRQKLAPASCGSTRAAMAALFLRTHGTADVGSPLSGCSRQPCAACYHRRFACGASCVCTQPARRPRSRRSPSTARPSEPLPGGHRVLATPDPRRVTLRLSAGQSSPTVSAPPRARLQLFPAGAQRGPAPKVQLSILLYRSGSTSCPRSPAAPTAGP